MTSKIFSMATFIVVSWLAVTVTTTSKRANTLEATLLNGMTDSASAMNARIAALEETQLSNHQLLLAELESRSTAPGGHVAQANNNGAEIESLQQQLASQTEFADLKQAYKAVIESELEKNLDPGKSAEKLLSTKDAIWKTSTLHPQVKDSLQGLMAPIDITAARWKSGDINGTVQPVFKVLKQTLATLDAD